MLIRNKLLVRFTLLVLGIQVGFSLFIYSFQARMRAQRFEHRLANSATLAGRLLVRTHKLETGQLGSLQRRDLLLLPSEQISIYDPGGTLRYTSADNISQAANRARLGQVGPGPARSFAAQGQRETVGLAYAASPAGAGHYRIFVTAEDRVGWSQHQQLGRLLVLGNLGALALTILAGWFFAGSALRPVARLTRQAGRISATNLRQRLPEGNGRDELAQLAAVFNNMLAGLEQAFEAQKSFLAHASHELRTPLTTLRGTLETALAYDQTLPDAQQSLARSLEAVQHLSALTNGLLGLARADGALPAFVPVRLDECLSQALDFARAKYPDREWRLSFGQFEAESEADLFTLPGNAELLTTALFNLLDNAGKYSTGRVRAELGYADAAHLQVRVIDTGTGLTAEELSRIYEPLFRGTGALKFIGYGLGLPLTLRVVQRHGGELHFDSVPGRGTTATVLLPVGGA